MEHAQQKRPHRGFRAAGARVWPDYVLSVGIVGICTLISLPLRQHLELTNFAMVYLLGVIAASVSFHRGAAIFSAFLSVTSFYYFCVPIHSSFLLEDSSYIIPLCAMLVVALVISTLMVNIRTKAAEALEHEKRTRNAEIAIETERMRNALLSAVSHDIKTPLSSIYGAATSFLEEETRLQPSARRELVESIAEEAERLNRVVSNLLEMTRLHAGIPAKRDWCALEEVVGAALTRLDKPLKGRPATTRIAAGFPLIWADDVLIEQVFINLVENATKYTPAGTPIEIVATYNDKRVTVAVRDFGRGFLEGEQEHVFDKFFRGKTDGVRGVGLGLAICRAIVDAHQGDIVAENDPEGGAIIRFELPTGGVPPEVSVTPESAFT